MRKHFCGIFLKAKKKLLLFKSLIDEHRFLNSFFALQYQSSSTLNFSVLDFPVFEFNALNFYMSSHNKNIIVYSYIYLIKI